MSSVDGMVYIVAGNACLREGLRELLAARGVSALVFGSAAECLAFCKTQTNPVPLVFVASGSADVVEYAIDLDRRMAAEHVRLTELNARYERLTPREREVLLAIVSGMLNKQAALHLGISENTVQIHRHRVMQKMEAESLPDLVRMADALGVPCIQARHTGKRKSSWNGRFDAPAAFDIAVAVTTE